MRHLNLALTPDAAMRRGFFIVERLLGFGLLAFVFFYKSPGERSAAVLRVLF
jgi:hypothetical protein